MKIPKSYDFKCGARMTYERGPRDCYSKVIMHHEHGVYHIRAWFMVSDSSTKAARVKDRNWIMTIYYHKGVKTFRTIKKLIDSLYEAKIYNFDLGMFNEN